VRPRTPFAVSIVAFAVAVVALHIDGGGALALSVPGQYDGRFGKPFQGSGAVIRSTPFAACDGVASVERQFVEDLKTKNMDGMLSLYAPGAVFIQPDSTQVVGHDALRKLYVTVFATYDSDLSLGDSDIRPVSAGSSLCVHTGQYAENLRTRKDGTVAHVRGLYSFTYKRMKDGRWLITRMRWTSGT
jgi:ketosteroid isomerase-like protein